MLLFEKFGQHQPLHRQAERYAREGVTLSLSTLAEQVGAGAATLMPIYRRIEAHVLQAERLHSDDTTVPLLAKGTNILQADAYSGFSELYAADRKPGPVLEASCWAHGRRKVFGLADAETAAGRQARGEKPNRSIRWRWKRCAASTRSSISSARSRTRGLSSFELGPEV